MFSQNLPTDKYIILFRHPNTKAWTASDNFDNPEAALEGRNHFASNGVEALVVNLRHLVENIPDYVLSQVERAVAEQRKGAQG